MSPHLSSPRISVVVIALNEGSNLRRTVENLQSTLNGNSEILVVDDGSDDGCADYLDGGDSSLRLAFSNPRMSLQWAKAEKVSLLGEDLLSKG